MDLRFHKSFSEIPADDWDALVSDESPFLESDYLFALEQFELAVPKNGWQALPISLWSDGELRGAVPLWAKGHSLGEFVYDHMWADAVSRIGRPYYPKLIVAVPFTPASGSRLLLKHNDDASQLLDGLEIASRGFASTNILFPDDHHRQLLSEKGYFERTQFQFWFHNQGYDSFDDFLQTLKSSKRKMIRRERRALSDLHFRWVKDPSLEEMRQMHEFHSRTCESFGP